MLAARAASASVSVDARLCARGRRDGRTRVDARRAVGRDGARGALETITRRLGEACLSDARCAVVLRAESGGGGPTPPAPDDMTCRACGTDRNVRKYRADLGKYDWTHPHTRMCVKCHDAHVGAMTPEAREEFDKQCAEETGRRTSKALLERRGPRPPAPEGMTCRACGTDRNVRKYNADLGKYYWKHAHTRMCKKCHKAYLDAMTPRERDEFLHECAEKNRETWTRILRESCPYG